MTNDKPQSGANLYPPGVWLADVMSSFSGVTLALFRFSFSSLFMLSLKPRSFVQSFLDMHDPRQPHAVMEMSLLPSTFVPFPLSLLYGEYVPRFFLPDSVFLPCDQGLGF